MLLNSVIIILREVLEAALLFSILLALSQNRQLSKRWIGLFLVIGSIGAFSYGLNIESISEWFEGVGQEVANAILQCILYCLLLIYLILQLYFQQQKTFLSYIMILICSIAMIREGSEIILYFMSVIYSPSHLFSVILGFIVGTSIAMSIGFLFYFLLIQLKPKASFITAITFLIFVGAGFISQACTLLMQADWLPSQLPLWDTSQWISEHSVLGQLLYALMGYEATPNLIQLGFYGTALAIPMFIIVFGILLKKKGLIVCQ